MKAFLCIGGPDHGKMMHTSDMKPGYIQYNCSRRAASIRPSAVFIHNSVWNVK